MKMSSWTGYGRLQASVRKQIAMRRAVELPPRVPAEKVSGQKIVLPFLSLRGIEY